WVPAWVVRHMVMKPLARQPRGTMAWIRDGDQERIAAHFGSRRQWEAIGDWTTFTPSQPDRTPSLLDHGYDESRDRASWRTADTDGGAEFRGGQLVSQTMTTGDVQTPLRWSCADGHVFTGSPRLILTAGHWCPQCVRDSAGYARQARANRFLAQ